MKDELGGKQIKGFAALRAKTCSYLTSSTGEDYIHCLEATQLENKVNQLEENKVDVESLRKSYKEFAKNKKININITAKF